MRYLVSDWTLDRSLPVQNFAEYAHHLPLQPGDLNPPLDASWSASFLGDSSVSKMENATANDPKEYRGMDHGNV